MLGSNNWHGESSIYSNVLIFTYNITVGIVPIFCETLFNEVGEKRKEGSETEYQVFNNYPAKSHRISSGNILRYSARLSRIIVLLFTKLITKQLVTFLNLSVNIFSLHFLFPQTKGRISLDICYLRMTDIESVMTILG